LLQRARVRVGVYCKGGGGVHVQEERGWERGGWDDTGDGCAAACLQSNTSAPFNQQRQKPQRFESERMLRAEQPGVTWRQ
jgi:hypothetical protein